MFKHFGYFLSIRILKVLLRYLDIQVFFKLRKYLDIGISLVFLG